MHNSFSIHFDAYCYILIFVLFKLTIFLAKIAHFVLSNQNTSICIRIHQNVCRMNCANVLCTKLPKKWILLHFNRLKLKNYLYLFVMEDPVVCKIVLEIFYVTIRKFWQKCVIWSPYRDLIFAPCASVTWPSKWMKMPSWATSLLLPGSISREPEIKIHSTVNIKRNLFVSGRISH